MLNILIIMFVKFITFTLKCFGRRGGNLPGKIAKKLNPDILKYLKIDCPVIAVTATNGKTSTNNCIKAMIENNNKKVISNSDGNNMETGIITALLKECKINGKVQADFITLEVDESYVPKIFTKMKLDTLVILDFFRDQLDRNGEVETLILKINEFLKNYNGNLVLNSDDPNVSRLGKANEENENIYYFSAEKYEYATEEEKEAGEGKFCPFDKTRLEYDYYQYSHIGKFHCPECNFGNQEIYAKAVELDVKNGSFTVDGVKYETLSNNIYTIYNFTAVIAVAKIYGLDAKETLKTFKLDNGRCEKITVNGCETLINLAKNPTGANVSLRMLNEDMNEKELLFVLNDNLADGSDVSWIWDINFDIKNVTRIVTSGKRAYDIAIRIKTTGFDVRKIESYLSLDEAVQALYKTKTKKYVIANYTALQPTRKEIKKINSAN